MHKNLLNYLFATRFTYSFVCPNRETEAHKTVCVLSGRRGLRTYSVRVIRSLTLTLAAAALLLLLLLLLLCLQIISLSLSLSLTQNDVI